MGIYKHIIVYYGYIMGTYWGYMVIMKKKMETTIDDVQYLGHKKNNFHFRRPLEGLNMSKKMKFGYCTTEVKRVPFHPFWGNDSKTFGYAVAPYL